MAIPPAGDNNHDEKPSCRETPAHLPENTSGTVRRCQEKFTRAFSCVSDIILITNREMRISSVTPSAETLLGYKPEELLGMPLTRPGLLTPPSMEQIKKHAAKALAGEPTPAHVYEFVAKNGKIMPLEAITTPFTENGEITGIIAVARDITGRRDMEELSQRLEDRHHSLIETIPDGYFEIDLSGKYTFVNDIVCTNLQRTREELIGKDNREFQTPENAKLTTRLFLNVYQTGIPERGIEIDILSKDGSEETYELSISLIKDTQGNPTGFRGISRNVTGRKKMEEALLKSEEKYRTIVENAQEGIFQTSPGNRSLTMNQALADMLGYCSSEEAAGELINNFQQAYVDPETYREVMKTLRQHGSIKSFEAQLYRKDKSLIWANMSITAVKDTAGNLLYYHGIVEDISPQKKLEQERQNSIDNMRKSLGATIKALSAITEARDPYTAGHQKRVADLARTIATEMGLSSDRIDGIRLAGMIHDLGKIVIPSEILTKPTKLTNLEMEIIKTHAQAGYDILKDIEFPWPIARMVHEHHERIDGSGYPQRLKGDDILLESKIIAVADVVEAISSYRPYRPALGIETALEEIESKSGILYDQTVSRICLQLFREKHYSMPK